MARLTPWRRRAKTAFVLSGGGNLGAIQVGMLRALTDHGVRPDLVLGCSVGALNGAAYAERPDLDGVRALEEMWLGLDSDDLMPSTRLPAPVHLARKGTSLHSNDGLRSVVETVLGSRSFEDLSLAFQCVATAVVAADEHWFSTGPLVEPILASAALPAVYPVVEIDGVAYMDGAVVNDVPVSRAIALGCSKIWVLHVGNLDRPVPEARRPLDVAMQAYWIARHHRVKRDLAAVPAGIDLVMLPTGGRADVRYDDFSQTGDLVTNAYAATAAHLDSHHIRRMRADEADPGARSGRR